MEVAGVRLRRIASAVIDRAERELRTHILGDIVANPAGDHVLQIAGWKPAEFPIDESMPDRAIETRLYAELIKHFRS